MCQYLERVQSTLDPFGGRFLVHGAPVEVREGNWPGGLVIIEFPSIEQARAWYGSPAYLPAACGPYFAAPVTSLNARTTLWVHARSRPVREFGSPRPGRRPTAS